MIDENALGLLVSYFGIEDDEYGSDEVNSFVERFRAFRDCVVELAVERPPGEAVRLLALGHAIYLEVAEDERTGDPLAWLRTVRERLASQHIASVAILSHGGRWLEEDAPGPVIHQEPLRWFEWSAPSEPLRRALYAETATHPMVDEASGWGAGLYADTEALEALGRHPKNAPTPLEVAGAVFYRVSR